LHRVRAPAWPRAALVGRRAGRAAGPASGRRGAGHCAGACGAGAARRRGGLARPRGDELSAASTRRPTASGCRRRRRQRGLLRSQALAAGLGPPRRNPGGSAAARAAAAPWAPRQRCPGLAGAPPAALPPCTDVCYRPRLVRGVRRCVKCWRGSQTGQHASRCAGAGRVPARGHPACPCGWPALSRGAFVRGKRALLCVQAALRGTVGGMGGSPL